MAPSGSTRNAKGGDFGRRKPKGLDKKGMNATQKSQKSSNCGVVFSSLVLKICFRIGKKMEDNNCICIMLHYSLSGKVSRVFLNILVSLIHTFPPQQFLEKGSKLQMCFVLSSLEPLR